MTQARSNSRRGFTLVELLMVMAVMMLMITLTAPATRGVLDAFHVTQGTNVMQGILDGAREQAVSVNRPIAVWICRPKDSTVYNTIQVLTHEPSGKWKPVARAVNLPEGYCISSNPAWTSVMSLDESTSTSDTPRVGRLDTNYAYRQVLFFPSGMTSLEPDSKWFLTVVDKRSETLNVLPKNFGTLRIDPVNGLITAHRP